MYSAGIGRRYATALVEFAARSGEEERVYAQIPQLLAAWRNRAFREEITSPVRSVAAKHGLMAGLFDGGLCSTLDRFLSLVLSHRRERHLDIILRSYITLYKERHRLADAVVTTAAELEPAFRERLQRLIERQTDHSVTIDWHVDPSLLGGFVVRIEDTQIDAGLARQIEKLQNLMA